MRGLKLSTSEEKSKEMAVASFTDAWIETLKLIEDQRAKSGRIFYRCVDWNKKLETQIINLNVASFTDAWIETNII